jgi:hypothetical protein
VVAQNLDDRLVQRPPLGLPRRLRSGFAEGGSGSCDQRCEFGLALIELG